MKILWCMLIGILSIKTAFAQKNSIVKGILMDTIHRKAVGNASVSLLRLSDSTMINYVMSTDQGSFQFRDIPKGVYYLSITHIQYYPSTAPVTINVSGVLVDVGTLIIRNRMDTLKEVTIKAEVPPVTMIGDTLQYNAGSFKVRPNSNVEELLKKLPGIEVSRDGTVTIQGKTVTDVLVDGKQFFGSNPKIATRNLQADMVDKVQVFDRLSDQAQFTGFDDGQGKKTINLKLKDDRKKGAFGSTRVGGGITDRFAGQANINAFTSNTQLSLIGQGNNVNSSNGDYDPSGGSGLNTLWSGGANFNNTLNKRTDLTGSYFFNNASSRASAHVQRQYLLNDSSYFYRERSENRSYNNGHRIEMSIDIRTDSSSSLKLYPSLNINSSKQYTGSSYQQKGQDGHLSNEGINNNESQNNSDDVANELLYRRKLGRAGRTISFALQTSFTRQRENEFRSSFNTIYDKSGHVVPADIDTLRQQGNNNANGYTYAATVTYTEPVGQTHLLALSVEQANTRNKADKAFFDYSDASGKYDRPNVLQSNAFDNRNGHTNAGLQWLTQRKTFRYNIGFTLQRSIINGISDSVFRKTYFNLLTKAGIKYDFTHYRNLSLDYQTNTIPPSIEQLQPVQSFNNPLFINEGNPNLRQEYDHQWQLSYTAVNPIRKNTFMASLSLALFKNHIVTKEVVDSIGVRRSKPVNVDGAGNMDISVNTGFPVDALNMTVNTSLRGIYTKSKQFINTQLNNANAFSLGPGLRMVFDPFNTLNVSLAAHLDINATHYSLQQGPATSWVFQYYESGITWRLPVGFYWGTDFSYSINSGALNDEHTAIPLWNTFLSLQFLGSQRAEVKLAVHDILNRGVQIGNTSAPGYVESRQGLSLQRFVLLTFTYNIQGISI